MSRRGVVANRRRQPGRLHDRHCEGSAAWQVPIAVQAALCNASWSGARLMIGYRALDLGADPLTIGVLAATFAAPALIAALPLGRAIDRWGGPRLALSGILVILVAVTLVLATAGLPWLLVGSGLFGLGHVTIIIAQQAFVASRSSDRSSSAFGNLTAAVSVGQLVGPPVVTTAAAFRAAEPGGAPDTFAGLLAAAAFAVVAVPLAVLLQRRAGAAGARSERRETNLALIRTPGLWRSMVLSGVVLATTDLLLAFLPMWAQDHGVSVRVVGALLATRALVSVASRVGLERLVSRVGSRTLIIVSVAVTGVALAAMPFAGTAAAFAVMAVLGFGLGVPQPLTMTWVVGLTDPAQHGAALGLRMSANRLAQVSFPVAVGAVVGPLGSSGVFFTNAAILWVALFVMPRRLDRQRPAVDTSDAA